jgi:polyhydroxyalkanoate synthesis regulator phasin
MSSQTPTGQSHDRQSHKKMLAGGLIAGLIAGSGAGFVLTQGGFAGAADLLPSAVVVEDDATGTDASTDETRPEPGTRLAEILAPLVADGTLTQAQADAVVAAVVEAAPFEGRGPGGPGGRGGHGHRGEHLGAIAEAIGIETSELIDAIRDGSTIAEIAAINGVDAQVVIDAAVAEVAEHLDAAVANGRLTEEEAAEKLAEATERITARVNGEEPPAPESGTESGS